MPVEYVVATADELPPGGRKIVTIRNLQIGLFRIGNEYYALPNVCTHQFGPLCEGRIGPAIVSSAETEWQPRLVFENEVIACPWHGLEFHIKTGRCLAYPNVRVRSYPIKAEGNEIKVIL